jgi:hypothetical protein
MKSYILPVIILIALLLGFKTQIDQSLELYNEGTDILRENSQKVESLEGQVENKKRSLVKQRKESLRKEAMLRRWEDHLAIDSFTVNRVLDAITSKHGCLPSNSSNEPTRLEFDGVKMPVHSFSTTILGDFKSVLRVIGEIEEEFPTAMVREIQMGDSLSGVSCKLTIIIPKLIS